MGLNRLHTLFKNLLVLIPFAVLIAAVDIHMNPAVMEAAFAKPVAKQEMLISSHTMDLQNRYNDQWVNSVFSDNILLNLAYLSGKVTKASEINWEEVRKPSTYEFTLQPGEVFAFHDNALPQFAGRVVKTTNSQFGAEDGYLSSGRLYGDGVCHFASIINWTARDAGLNVVAPTNHNFAVIPGIDAQYGTAIYYMYGTPEVNMQQNLYVENTLDVPVRMVFENTGDELKVSVYK
jgi:hypothetical protein